MSIKTGIIIPDCHVPFHDKVAFKLALSIIAKLQPEYVVIIGDFADFYAVSLHGCDPGRQANMKWEIQEVNKALDRIEKLGIKKVIYCEGNHETRLTRYIMKKAPELDGLLSAKEAFKIKERGWTWVPYMDYLQIGKLYVTHDYGRSGKYCAQQTLADFQHNIAFGHSHRATLCYSGNAVGEQHVGASLGWLGDPSTIDYMHKRKIQEWQHGVGLFYLEPNKNVHLHFVPFLNGKAIVPSQPVLMK